MLHLVEPPRPRHPELERPVAELERAGEIALPSPHREGLALHREHGRHHGLVPELVGERGRLLGRRQRLDLELAPQGGVSVGDQGLEPLVALELGQQGPELVRGALVAGELKQCVSPT